MTCQTPLANKPMLASSQRSCVQLQGNRSRFGMPMASLPCMGGGMMALPGQQEHLHAPVKCGDLQPNRPERLRCLQAPA